MTHGLLFMKSHQARRQRDAGPFFVGLVAHAPCPIAGR
jgi:hypothetical protein